MHDDEYPCPCDACDEFSLMEGEYCVTCVHHDCGWDAAKCPPAQRSAGWCDFCNEKTEETVKAHPEADGNHICADCHPEAELPEEDEWWVSNQNEDGDRTENMIEIRAEENHSLTEF